MRVENELACYVFMSCASYFALVNIIMFFVSRRNIMKSFFLSKSDFPGQEADFQAFFEQN